MRRGARAAAKLKEGEAPPDSEAPFIVFAEDMSAAMAECETRAVVELRGAGKDDWRASLAFLERKFPKKWGQRIHMHVDEELDAFLSRIESNLDRATFERVLRAANGEISAVPAAQSPGREDRGEGGEPDPDSDAG